MNIYTAFDNSFPMKIEQRMKVFRLFEIVIAIALFSFFVPGAIADSTSTNNPVNPKRITPAVKVYQKTHKAVVNISSTSIIKERSSIGSPFGSIFQMPKFFGPPREVKEQSVGSGFVIEQDGYIVTNAHVVAQTAKRKVIFANGKKYPAKIIAIDTKDDLALLKVDVNHKLPTIQLGKSNDLMVGERVVAIGNPFGFENTLTSGVVSALHRQIHIKGNSQYKNLIQTDASINPGNSGGPLLNILGKLVGINTAIRQHANNIGFAIPVAQLRSKLPQMLDVQRRYHFVTGLSVKTNIKKNEKGDDKGVVITDVKNKGPAVHAGLRAGQVIVKIDDVMVHSRIDYAIALIGKKAGQNLKIKLQDGTIHTLTLGKRPKPNGKKLLIDKFGIQANALSRQKAKRFGLSNLHGLIITGIGVNSPADKAGFKPGDIIIQLGQHSPESLSAAGQMLEKIKKGERVSIVILRIHGRSIYRFRAALTAQQ